MTSYANTFNPLGADESFDCPQKLSRNSPWIDAPAIALLSGLLRIAGASGESAIYRVVNSRFIEIDRIRAKY